MLLTWMDQKPRAVLGWLALVCVALLAFGLYLQHAVGLDPCPMCIVQRYALVLVALVATLGALCKQAIVRTVSTASIFLLAGFGAFVAARQSWLQWYPPQEAACGRDLYGMIETFPLQRVIPMIFKGSGDCSKVDWTFLSLSIANWSFLCFSLIGLIALVLLTRQVRTLAGKAL